MAAVAPRPQTGPVSDTQKRAPVQPSAAATKLPEQHAGHRYQQHFENHQGSDVLKTNVAPAVKVRVKHPPQKRGRLTPAQVDALLARDNRRHTTAPQNGRSAVLKAADDEAKRFHTVAQGSAALGLEDHRQQYPENSAAKLSAEINVSQKHSAEAGKVYNEKKGRSLAVSGSVVGGAQVYKKKQSKTTALRVTSPGDTGTMAQQKSAWLGQGMKCESDRKDSLPVNVPRPLKKSRCSIGTMQCLSARTGPDQEQVPSGAPLSCKSNSMNRDQGVDKSGESVDTQGNVKPLQPSQVLAVSAAREGCTEHAVPASDKLQAQAHNVALAEMPAGAAYKKPCKLPTRTTKRAAALNAIPAIVTADVLDFEDSPIMWAVRSPCRTRDAPSFGHKRRLPDEATHGTTCRAQRVRKVTKKAARRTKSAMIVSGKSSRKKVLRTQSSWEGPLSHVQEPVREVHVPGSDCLDTGKGHDVQLSEVDGLFPAGPWWPNDSLSWAWSETENMHFAV